MINKYLYVWTLLAVVPSLIGHFHSNVTINILETPEFKLYLNDNPHGGYNLCLKKGVKLEVISLIGRNAGKVMNVMQNGDTFIQFVHNTTLRVSPQEVRGHRRGWVLTFTWEAPKNAQLDDCVHITLNHWFGGPEQKRQYWPIERLPYLETDYSYVTKEIDNCAIIEPYWLNSEGFFFYFDQKVPLFLYKHKADKNAACFSAKIKPPYSSKRERNQLIYALGIFDDVKKAHEYAIDKYLGKPSGIPDERMIKYPIWSTWARYKKNINQNVVLKFADEINENGFPNSQLEIDDLWEICYGSQTVDERRFPNMTGAVDSLKAKGFRITMWTHPFINKGCEPWYSEALDKGYLISSERGSVETSWWNNNGTSGAYIDFTKPDAREWYTGRLRALKKLHGIDSFKFDAGESGWTPQIPVLQGDIELQPGSITEAYVRAVAEFGPMIEIRSGRRTQDLPVFVRMIDKDTYWTFENGLPTLLTTLLQMNMNGYPLVLPDMIGGNGYNEPPSKELFIRWLQATTFMPAMQFSYVPWDYDNETIEISKKFGELHAEYAPQIVAACRRAAADGTPVNAPIWWLAPNDTTAHDIWDEYLLGDLVLAAPVLERDARTRHVYLPPGEWRAQGDPARILQGGEWIREYPAPLDTLPYFVKA